MRKSYFSMAVLFVLIFCFSSVSLAGLTVTSDTEDVWGKKRVKIKSIAFDSSYASGGESLTKASMGLAKGDMVIIEPKNGYAFEYDYTNEKVKVFTKAPPVVYDEQHDIAGNSIYLRYPAAFIMSVSNDGAPVLICTSGATTLATSGECQPIGTWTDGALSGVTFGTSMSGMAYITYITQAWREVWDNVVQNESVVMNPSAGNTGYLANAAVAIQAISALGDFSTNGVSLMYKNDTVATGEILVDFTPFDASTVTSVTAFATDVLTGISVTYISRPATGFYLNDNFIEEGAVVAPASIGGTSQYAVDYPILIWSYGGQLPINTLTNYGLAHTGATLSGTASIDWYAGSGVSPAAIKVYETSTPPTLATYVRGRPGDVETRLLEVPGGADLSDLSGVKVILIGR